ncbi:MAG: cell division protein PerM [Geodermatophilaceae bacterium]
MTSVLTRWLASPTQPETPSAHARTTGSGTGMLVAGAVAGLGAAAAGLLVLGALIGLAWIVEPAVGGSVLGPARLSAQAWLLGHGADVTTGGIIVALTPLGLTALLVVCCWCAACWAGRRARVDCLAQVAVVLAALAVTYTAVGMGLTVAGSTSGADIGFVSTLPGLLSLSLLAGLGGLLRTAGHGRLIHDISPFPSRAIVAGVGAGAAVLVAAGVGTLGVAIAADRAGFTALVEGVAPDWSAGIGLFVLSLLLLPNAALYAIAVLVGPGFSIGSGTTISAFGVTLGVVPGLPLFAALPDRPAVPLGALLGLGVPLLCGLMVGAVVARRLDDETRPLAGARWGATAALTLAVALGAAQWLASGSLGDGRLDTVGAAPIATLAAAAVLLVLPAALSAGLLRRRQIRRR